MIINTVCSIWNDAKLISPSIIVRDSLDYFHFSGSHPSVRASARLLQFSSIQFAGTVQKTKSAKEGWEWLSLFSLLPRWVPSKEMRTTKFCCCSHELEIFPGVQIRVVQPLTGWTSCFPCQLFTWRKKIDRRNWFIAFQLQLRYDRISINMKVTQSSIQVYWYPGLVYCWWWMRRDISNNRAFSGSMHH